MSQPPITQPFPQPYGEYFMRVGDKDVYGIDFTFWLSQRWRFGASVAQNYAIRPTIPNGFQYICTIAGQSADSEPQWPSAGTVNDGSVTWTAEPIDTTSLTATVQSVIWTPDSGIVVSAPGFVGQVVTALIDATASVAGTDYIVAIAATMTDGEVKTGHIKFKVR